MTVDILLADCSGQGWLVRGEQYIDDLLANTLPPDVSIEVVPCESKSALDDLRARYAGEWDTDAVMWLIHPAIVNRARGQTGVITITFPEWSAALDGAADAAIAAAAKAVLQQDGRSLVLMRHLDPDGPAIAAQMANVRSLVLEQRLAERGVPPDRVSCETQDVTAAGQGDRIELLIRP